MCRWVCAVLVLALTAPTYAYEQRVLVDFGDNNSYRGISVSNPDANGHFWNNVAPGATVFNLVTTDNTPTTIDLAFSTSAGTDSYNGPAGATDDGVQAALPNTDIDAVALGDLGITNAAFDYINGGDGAPSIVRFELQQLDPAKYYDLTFFGSHKFNADSTTIYSVYTDDTYSTHVASTSLDVHQPGSPWLHNRDQVTTLSGLKPQAGDALYIQFTGSGGNGGYLNALAITTQDAVNESSDRPVLLSATTDGVFAILAYAATPGSDYALDWAPVLVSPISWQEVQLGGADANGGLRFTNLLALPPTNSFYRVRLVGSTMARGAAMPYRTYEAEQGVIGGGASVLGPSFEETDTASEASGRQFVELDQTGEYVEWTVEEAARGMVLRFTMPDAPTGGGTSATLGLYVNGLRVANLPLTSKWAWQYFPTSGAMDPSNDPTVNPRPRMRFDDQRHIFATGLNAGDVIRLQKDGQDTSVYGIDLIELESIPAAIPAPANSLSVTSYGAVPDDGEDDLGAFNTCEADARAQGKTVYLPPGRYEFNQRWALYSVRVQGAGVWHTELHFTNPNNCGIRGESVANHTTEIRDLYMTTELTIRNDSENGLSGYFGQSSIISNLWVVHFNTGGWIAEYASGLHLITDGLVVSGCRLRNTYADGLNFTKGSRNCVVENTNFRNNGDDAMATWSSDASVVPETMNNTFRFNTVENTWRAAGLGIFGGRGHIAHDCIIRDVSGQAGIRFNTVFPGHPFSTNSEIVVSNMTVLRTTGIDLWGNKLGAVAFQTQISPVHHIQLSNMDIEDSNHHSIFYQCSNGQAIDNVFFHTATVNNSGEYGIYVTTRTGGWSENSFVTVTNSGGGAVADFSAAFELRKIEGNVGW